MHEHENICDCNIIHPESVDYVKEKLLPEETIEQLSMLFKVLDDPTRLKIIWALDNKELCVCDLSAVLNMTKSAISHQLALLKRANLVKFRKEGKTVYYSLSDEHIKIIFEYGLEHINE